MDISYKASPSWNMDTNPKELHTPKSIPKNPTWNNKDKKNKLKLDMVLCKNKA